MRRVAPRLLMDPPDSVQMWALPLPLPGPRIAELIGVVSERTQLKE